MNKIVEVATDVDAAPRTVWTALTARQTALFPGSEVETDWVVGHSIEFSGTWRGKAYRDRGRVREFDRERKLTFDYWCDLCGEEQRPENRQTITCTLAPRKGGTRVILSQYDPTDAGLDDRTRAEYARSWELMLRNLKEVAERMERASPGRGDQS